MKTILAHILPKQSLFDGEHAIPLDNSSFYNTVLASLKEWVDSRSPSICLEHERNGESLGYVSSIIDDEKGMFAQLVLNDSAAATFDEGSYRYVSPTIAWNHRADDYLDHGVWPASLLEVSFVSVPRHSRQIPVAEMAQLNENNSQPVFYNETEKVSRFSAYVGTNTAGIEETYFITDEPTELSNEGENDMDLEKLHEILSGMLDERLAPLYKRLDDLEMDTKEDVKEDVDEVVEDTEAAEEVVEDTEDKEEIEVEAAEEVIVEEKKEELIELSEVDALKATIKTLEKRSVLAEANVEKLNAEIAHRDAVMHVSGDIAARPHLSAMSERLVSIFKTDKTLYGEVLDVVPAGSASVLNERVTVGYSNKDVSLGNPYEAAAKLAADEGIEYREAFTRLNK